MRPQLLPGAFGVPVPTVLIAPWQLDACINAAQMNLSDLNGADDTGKDPPVDDPSFEEGAGGGRIHPVTAGDQWSSVEPAFPLTGFRHDKHGLKVAVLHGKLWSLISMVWSNPTWDEAATQAGHVMVATADLPLYWSAVEQGRFPTFQDTFGDGCWAALAPFHTGPEADLSTWPGAGNFGL